MRQTNLIAIFGGTGVLLLVLFCAPRSVLAGICDSAEADAASVEAARLAVRSQCDCALAESRHAWKKCVKTTLRGLVTEGSVSRPCYQLAKRLEYRAICGLPGREICCRTNARGETLARPRRIGRCDSGAGVATCVSPHSHLEEACVVGGCAPAPGCGNGVLDLGEACDPPNGTTCAADCNFASCADDGIGQLLACHEGSPEVQLEGVGDSFLAAFGGVSLEGASVARVRRFGTDGTITDPEPIRVSQADAGDAAPTFNVSTLTENGTSFYLGITGRKWAEGGALVQLFNGLALPADGEISVSPKTLASNVPFGSCRMVIQGPLGIAPDLAGSGVHVSYREVFGCAGTYVRFETLVGVPGPFEFPPPGNLSFGAASHARGSSDVAAVWWNRLVTSLSPLAVVPSLRVGWLEPGPEEVLDLTVVPLDIATSESPAVAALDDVFLVVWTAASDSSWAEPNELRGIRFRRDIGRLDPYEGLLLASGSAALGRPVVDASDSGFAIAWTETRGVGDLVIRALRLGSDGSVLDALPLEIGTLSDPGEIDIAATASGTFVVYAGSEPSGSVAVRVVDLPEIVGSR